MRSEAMSFDEDEKYTMRLPKTATVSKFERQKALCVGVVVVLVLRLFFAFFEISHWRAVGRP